MVFLFFKKQVHGEFVKFLILVDYTMKREIYDAKLVYYPLLILVAMSSIPACTVLQCLALVLAASLKWNNSVLVVQPSATFMRWLLMALTWFFSCHKYP